METEALIVYLLWSYARIAQDFMLWVAPHVAHNGDQNQYLAKYDDFRIGEISDDMLSKEFDGKTLREHLKLPGAVGNITKTVFTTKKASGRWKQQNCK
eukprot:2260469-Ditylum_brightwellii.AAC.1